MKPPYCTCIYHCNINFLISAVHKAEEDFPEDHRSLLAFTTCSSGGLEVENCQFGVCEDCNKLCTLEKLVEMVGSSEVLLAAWFVEFDYWEDEKDREGKDRLRKVVKYESLLTILKMILSKWHQFRCRCRCRCR